LNKEAKAKKNSINATIIAIKKYVFNSFNSEARKYQVGVDGSIL